jgi:hypothetical protein
MRDATFIGPWVRRFLLEHVITDRNFAHNTQVSYLTLSNAGLGKLFLLLSRHADSQPGLH